MTWKAEEPTLSHNSDSFGIPASTPLSLPAKPLQVPPEIHNLVCETCWHTFFSPDSFHTAWASQYEPIFSESAHFSYITLTWGQIQQTTCHWCTLLCREVKMFQDIYENTTQTPSKKRKFQVGLRFAQESELDDTVTLLLVIDDTWKTVFQIHTTENDPAARFIRDREVFWDIDSPESYNLIKKRIDECSRHDRCPQPRHQGVHLPTRVIDCADEGQPRLFVGLGAEGNYVALSYVWGENQPNCTKSSNLDSYTEAIPLDNIPKTILDAITVTRKLGLRFLWVDALCILQDSREDKAREIAQMQRIFHDAYVTVIAACARKVSDGFLHDRRATIAGWDGTLLPFRCPDGGIGTMQLQSLRIAPKEPVDERAWCLEERALSPRRLIYATHTLLYECQTSHDNINGAPSFIELCDAEDIPRLPDNVFLQLGTVDLDNRTSLKAWCDILETYTLRALTKPRDRLVALSGIVEQFHRVWPQSRYLAGLWEHQLPATLLWFTRGKVERRHREGHRYRAPSWSWASMDGGIFTGLCANEDILCSVMRCEVWQRDEEVVDGELVLDVILQPAVWDPVVVGSEEGHLFDPQTDPVDDCKRGGRIGDVMPDAIESVPGDVHLALVKLLQQAGDFVLHGLVLIPSQSRGEWDERVFRRVGWFSAPFRRSANTKAWLDSRRQRIMIV
ncbi:heterokaryon incompatibility protein-domain-containing protein [Armillaria luteobubalina]|uniref:Heterokaryon incompatibility protein-domain-containing protein n=1 Tax=Armillaria luteobubalina TaxID=153913 RepID=A0AA39QIQ0_9AGAR|nr:heterokaryon incompatibility protein-domain-containing protein [Armillaria luteobubalina]